MTVDEAADCRWGPYVAQRIDDLRRGVGRGEWEGDWPAPAAVALAWDWACKVMPPTAPTPSVVPTGEGWVDFVWHKSGWDIEFEVGPEDALAWWHHRDSGQMGNLDLADQPDRERLSALLADLGRDGNRPLPSVML